MITAEARVGASCAAIVLGGALTGGVMVGAAGLSSSLWPLAWSGVAALAFSLDRARRPAQAIAGLLLFCVAQRLLWQGWGLSMARAMAPGDVALQWVVAAGFLVATALPVFGLLAAGVVGDHLLRGRGAFARSTWPGVSLWLPLGWAIGERIEASWTSVATDWLFTQVEVAPVMGVLARLGLVPATLLCLGVASLVGEALAAHRPRRLALPAALAAGLCLVPPPPRANDATLEGVGAVHMRSPFELPALDVAAPDLALAVWPEASLAERLPLGDGPAHDVSLDVELGGRQTEHLVGLVTPTGAPQRNLVVHARPSGNVQAARAKRVLFPVFERRFLGVGDDVFVPGSGRPLLRAGDRNVVPLVCGEFLTRGIVGEGARAGGALLSVSARDTYQGKHPQADWQVLAHLRLRAIEYGLPAVYASLGGRASLVASDGSVLARSDAGAPSGVLTWSAAGGPKDTRPVSEPSIAVLFAPETEHLRPDCPPGRCVYLPLGDPPPEGKTFSTVIVSGHGTPTAIGGHPALHVARSVAALRPDLVVLDACFSASTPLLAALAEEASGALIIAAPFYLDGRGLHYDPPFFTALPPEVRSLSVYTWPPSPLYVGRPDASSLARAEREVASQDGDSLRPHLRNWDPTLVAWPLEGGQRVLVPADWRAIGHPASAGDEQGAGPVRFRLFTLWLDRPGVERRLELDAFLRCLVDGSNFATFFRGEASLSLGGSWVVPRPEGPLDEANRQHWLEPIVASLPEVPEDVVPIYLVLGPAADVQLQSACGYHHRAVVAGRKAGLALVRTQPSCWPGTPPLRSETQVAMHEIAEGIDELLGHMGCVANGRCEGAGACGDPCDAFTGLHCPGAPESTPTGCDDVAVRGWVVQRLAHKGWTDDHCAPCAPCDFTITATPPPP